MKTADRPGPLLPGGDLQTVVPAFWPRPAFRHAFEIRDVPVAPGNAVRVLVSRPAGPPRGSLLILHGLGGSAESGYVVHTAHAALDRGLVVARMNMRNCGGTEALSTTLYNAGQSGDVDRVLAALDDELPRPVAAAGFSLGGNVVLRYAGLSGDACRADRAIGVNPPVDLDRCLREMERPRNRLYDLYYVRKLCAQIRAVRAVRPLDGPDPDPRRIGGTRRFDGLFTAPDAGFATAEEYYAASSAGPTLGGARRPVRILSARNDPFVPAEIFAPLAGGAVELDLPDHGGHCGYWGRGRPRFWAAAAIVEAACPATNA